MITIAFVTFRESMEVLLVLGLLFASLEQLHINKKQELLVGAGVGILFSIALFLLFSLAGQVIHFKLDHETGEIMEGINYLGSGIFLFITAILLHRKMKSIISQNPSSLLNTSLFAVGFLSVVREGIEIVFFSISASLSSSFFYSFIGFSLGIFSCFIVGMLGSKLALTRFSHRNLLTVSDWGIKILSAYFVIKGIVILSEFIL